MKAVKNRYSTAILHPADDGTVGGRYYGDTFTAPSTIA